MKLVLNKLVPAEDVDTIDPGGFEHVELNHGGHLIGRGLPILEGHGHMIELGVGDESLHPTPDRIRPEEYEVARIYQSLKILDIQRLRQCIRFLYQLMPQMRRSLSLQQCVQVKIQL